MNLPAIPVSVELFVRERRLIMFAWNEAKDLKDYHPVGLGILFHIYSEEREHAQRQTNT